MIFSVRVGFFGRRSGTAISRTPVRYSPVSEFGLAMMSIGRAFGDDLAAMDAGAGADIDHIVGGADGVLVMLDDDHGVAEVAQSFQRDQEARVVALMQPDRRLVEHVEHAGQAGADLRGKPDALALAAGQRAARPGQCQVIEPDIDQKFQPGADLLEDAHGDFVLLGVELVRHRAEPRAAALTDKSETSPICRSPILTHNASGLRR